MTAQRFALSVLFHCFLHGIVQAQPLELASPGNLQPGGARRVQIAFGPTPALTKAAKLATTSNDPETPTLEMLLTGARSLGAIARVRFAYPTTWNRLG